jgi:hypothetical protein
MPGSGSPKDQASQVPRLEFGSAITIRQSMDKAERSARALSEQTRGRDQFHPEL